MQLHNKKTEKINPSTEEKQASIKAALDALSVALLGGLQKTQLVDPAGTQINFNGRGKSVQVRLTRPADVVQYSAGDVINASVAAPVSLNLADMAIALGGFGIMMAIDVTSNMLGIADATLRLWFYRSEPSGLVGDNLPMTNDDANTTKGRHYIDVKMNSILAGSTTILAQKEPIWQYVCAGDSKDMKLRIQTLTSFTPTSAGWIDVALTLIEL